jgi:hypothetical protein
MGSYLPYLHNQPPSFPLICGFTYSPLEDSHHLQLATCIITDGTTCQIDAPDTSVPWEPPPSGVSNLYLPPGPKIQRFPFLQEWG